MWAATWFWNQRSELLTWGGNGKQESQLYKAKLYAIMLNVCNNNGAAIYVLTGNLLSLHWTNQSNKQSTNQKHRLTSSILSLQQKLLWWVKKRIKYTENSSLLVMCRGVHSILSYDLYDCFGWCWITGLAEKMTSLVSAIGWVEGDVLSLRLLDVCQVSIDPCTVGRPARTRWIAVSSV